MRKTKILKFFVILVIVFIFYVVDTRICLFYNIFKIPCPGCGITQSFMLLLKGRVVESLSYNILTIPIMVCIITYTIFLLFRKEELIEKFIKKNEKIIITISVLVTLIVWVININNPKLY